jgi:glucose/mannose-6-phosphate isomerase
MINLDDKNAVLKIQGGDKVMRSIDAFPKQLKQAFDESLKISFPEEYKKIKNIVVCGMGGSRFTPLIVRELFKEEITVPYVINDDYNIPAFVDKNSLVILSSYSGTTEEVITCGQKAKAHGARLAGICAGGEIAKFLKEIGAPVYVFNPVHNPSLQPRIGSGYLVGGHIGFLISLELIKTTRGEIMTAIDNLPNLLQNLTIDVKKENNPAKKTALQLYQKYPYYLVSEFLTGVGNGVANQTNETAKSISSFRIIPELNHHLMEGLKFPDVHRGIAVFVFFFSQLYSPPIQKRFHITKDVIKQNKIQTLWHELKGESKVEQVLELIGFGSYLSMYLSTLYEQDPAAIPYVDYFKKKLKETKTR